MVYSRDEYGRITALIDGELQASFEYDELGRMHKQTVKNTGELTVLSPSWNMMISVVKSNRPSRTVPEHLLLRRHRGH